MEKLDRVLIQYLEDIHNKAEKSLKDIMPVPKKELFELFFKTGNRIEYEKVYFERRRLLTLYAIASERFEDKRYLLKLEEVINDICNEECWALPAHVSLDNPEWKNTVDLFSCETAGTFAELYSRKDLSDEVREKMALNVKRRVIRPFIDSKEPCGCFEKSNHNWNAVCMGNIGCAVLYLFDEDAKEYRECMRRVLDSLPYYLDGFKKDGTCMEGIDYFTYGMSYFASFAKLLYDKTNGKINLFDDERVRNIALFQQKMFYTHGNSVSFSDGDRHSAYRLGLTCLLAEFADGILLPPVTSMAGFDSDTCYRYMVIRHDIVWTEEYIKSGKGIAFSKRSEVFMPEASWYMNESENGCFFAIKGGNNAEPHNHNDIGAFLYGVDGEQLLCDLGAGEYTKDYFSAGRYNILCNSSLGHNVPIIDGCCQKDGQKFCSEYFRKVKKGHIQTEFSKAYGALNLSELERNVYFDDVTGKIILNDTVCFSDDVVHSFTENFVTRGKAKLNGNEIVVEYKGKKVVLQIFADFHCKFVDAEHKNHVGESEYLTLMQIDFEVVKKLNIEIEIDTAN